MRNISHIIQVNPAFVKPFLHILSFRARSLRFFCVSVKIHGRYTLFLGNLPSRTDTFHTIFSLPSLTKRRVGSIIKIFDSKMREKLHKSASAADTLIIPFSRCTHDYSDDPSGAGHVPVLLLPHIPFPEAPQSHRKRRDHSPR